MLKWDQSFKTCFLGLVLVNSKLSPSRSTVVRNVQLPPADLLSLEPGYSALRFDSGCGRIYSSHANMISPKTYPYPEKKNYDICSQSTVPPHPPSHFDVIRLRRHSVPVVLFSPLGARRSALASPALPATDKEFRPRRSVPIGTWKQLATKRPKLALRSDTS